MKTASLFFAASMAVAVAAKTLSDVLPKCAVDCANESLKTAKCKLDDTACICADQETYQTLLQPATECMLKECGQAETLKNVVPAVINFCAAANPKLTARPSAPSTSAPAVPKTTLVPSSKAPSAAASAAASETSPEASETAIPEKKWTSDQVTELVEATGSASPTAASSEQAASTSTSTSTTATAAPSTAAAAGAAGPMVAAALLVAGTVAML
ncbi:cell wall protein [Trichoderma reesei QM6a]|uniref:Cell wall protein n=2 Tax=Hypocrea jecorina TaxID=51453 RepID=G0REQ3_HYPJQ|nr:cell wall protein [Trichoderma reesei QM6a]EGR50527.1 cell wall protein [Trichoderma reesei QM6a]